MEFPSDALGRGAGQDAGGAALPGAGDADRHHRRRLLARGGGPAAPGARRPSRRPAPSTPSASGSSRAWRGTAIRRSSPSAASAQIEGFGEYGFPESHAASFALPRLCLGLAQVPPSGGLRLRAPELAAHGLLCPGADRARRARARGGGAPGLHRRQRLGQRAGARRPRRAGAAPGLPPDQGDARGGGGLDRGGARQRLPRRGRGLAAGGRRAADAGAPRRRGRLRVPGADAAGGALAGAGDRRRGAAAALRRDRGRGRRKTR